MDLLFQLSPAVSVLALVVSICVVIGGYVGIKYGYGKQIAEAQDKLNVTQKTQIDLLAMQKQDLEKELVRWKRVVATIQFALKKLLGLILTINDEYITIENTRTQKTHTVQIQANAIPLEHETP